MHKILPVAFLLILLFPLMIRSQAAPGRIRVAEDIELIRLSEKAYVHVSSCETKSFGRVSANGLLLIDRGEAFLIDSPWDNLQTEVLVRFIADSLRAVVAGFIPTHWHEDCMGGLGYLQKQGIPSYANRMTLDLAREKGLPVPQQGFRDSLALNLHGLAIDGYYLGGGHSTDNVVVWIPSEKILFGGCLVKESAASGLGNTADGDVQAWPGTIQKVIDKFPSAGIVIPGHGQVGGRELLLHTLSLVSK